MTSLSDFEHKLDTLIKTYPDGVPRDERNDGTFGQDGG